MVQAALVHAQFETIPPFADGNGRVGRALIHAVLARRGLVAGMALPVSPVLATLSRRYVAALTAFRAIPPGAAPAPTQEDDAHSGRLQWIAFFLEASTAAWPVRSSTPAPPRPWRGSRAAARPGVAGG